MFRSIQTKQRLCRFETPIFLEMLLPWKSNGLIIPAIEFHQDLYINRYPFKYKPAYQWRIIPATKNNLRIIYPEEVTHKNKYWGYFSHVFPFLTTLAPFITALLGIFILWTTENRAIWLDFKFWTFLFIAALSWLTTWSYFLSVYGNSRQANVESFQQFIELEVEIHQGKDLLVKISYFILRL